MKIRLATRRDLKSLQDVDHDPDKWAEEDFVGFIKAFGQVKMASEGVWPLGWIAYHKVNDLVIVERLILPNENILEEEVALRLTRHVEWLCRGAAAIDLALPDSKLNVAKVLATRGYASSLMRKFYPGGIDAVVLHKKLSE